MCKRLRRLRKENVCFLMVDIQGKLLPHMARRGEIAENSLRLLAAAKIMDIPLLYTEQYPKGLGKTEATLIRALPEGAKRFEKTCFSCMEEPDFTKLLRTLNKKPVTVVWGIEAHICIMSTVMDMLDEGMKVAVVSDAVGSRNREHLKTALSSMERSGALVLPTESVVYQLLGRAGTEEFKATLPFFRTNPKVTSEDPS